MPNHLDPALFLSIDQGGNSTRVGVYDKTGQQYAFAQIQVKTIHTKENHIELDPAEITSSITDCLTKIEGQLGDRTSLVVKAGLSGQGSSFLFWHRESKKPLTPIISWQDTRSKNCVSLTQLVTEEFKQKTGVVPSPHYGASKMLWCLTHLQELERKYDFQKICVGPIASYIFDFLSPPNAKVYVDPGHAQRTALWNINSCKWDEGLIRLFSMPIESLPLCKDHHFPFCHLPFSTKKIQLGVSVRDQAAALYAYGNPENDADYVNLGTGAFIQRPTQNRTPAKGILLSPIWFDRHSQEFAWEAPVNGAAAAIPWLEDHIGVSLSSTAIQQYTTAEPSRKIAFVNSICGLSAPYWRTDIAPKFIVEMMDPPYFLDETKADVKYRGTEIRVCDKVIAWIESIIFQIFENTTLMDSSLGVSNRIYISGGLSHLDVLCQKLADLTTKKVIRRQSKEASLLGCAYLTAGKPRSWTPDTRENVFHPRFNSSLSERFRFWKYSMTRALSNARGPCNV